jgi:hypothetical protein
MQMSTEQVAEELARRASSQEQASQPSLYKTLLRAGVSNAISLAKPTDVSQVTMQAKAPDPSQVGSESKDQERNRTTEQSFNASLGTSFRNSLNAKRVSTDFLVAYQEKQLASLPKDQQDAIRKSGTLKLLPIKEVAGAVVGASPEAIAAEFYSKKDLSSADPVLIKQMNETANQIRNARDAKNGALAATLESKLDSIKGRLASQSGNELRKYQDAYVEQATLQKQLDRNPSHKGLQNKLASVSKKLERMDAQAQTGYKQAVEIKQLDAKQAADRLQFVETARNLKYPNTFTIDAAGNEFEGPLDMRDPALRAAMADLRNNQAVERQRLKEKQMGIQEGRGKDNRSEPDLAAKAGAAEAKAQTRAAAEISSRRDEAAEMVKVAVDKGKYSPLPGESFEDSVKREMATGEFSKKYAEFKSVADERIRKMRADALAQQQTAKTEFDAFARIKAERAARSTAAPPASKEEELLAKQEAQLARIISRPSRVTVKGSRGETGKTGGPPESTQTTDTGYPTAAAATQNPSKSSQKSSGGSLPIPTARSEESTQSSNEARTEQTKGLLADRPKAAPKQASKPRDPDE